MGNCNDPNGRMIMAEVLGLGGELPRSIPYPGLVISEQLRFILKFYMGTWF